MKESREQYALTYSLDAGLKFSIRMLQEKTDNEHDDRSCTKHFESSIWKVENVEVLRIIDPEARLFQQVISISGPFYFAVDSHQERLTMMIAKLVGVWLKSSYLRKQTSRPIKLKRYRYWPEIYKKATRNMTKFKMFSAFQQRCHLFKF